MEKTRRRNWRKSILGLSAIVFAASFIVSLVPSIRAIAEGTIFKIKSAEITQLSSGVDGAISSHDDSTIVSDVTFHKLGDTATYKVVLQNTDSKDHVIETISDDNANSHISYSYDKHANETIAAGANLDFVFEAKYIKTPATSERSQVSEVKFSIRFTDIDEPEEVIVAPNTYDGLGASFVVLAISSLGLIVCAAIYIKSHKKAAKVLTVALVAALATAAITSVKAATVEVNSFTLTTNYGFYDKVVITYTDKNGDEQELISNYNEPVNIPDQSKDGYTLTGWEDEQGNPVDPTQPITEDIKIHPIYRTHTYTIKFNGNGANGEMTDLAMTYDETKTLPTNAFNFPGRTYTGWDTEANGSGIHHDNEAEVKNLTAEDNGIVTLYAQWSINPFHIDYDGNGATSGEMATTNCEYDQACQLRENAFEKYGYDFAGWKYNNADYADKVDVTNIIDKGTITMVAQWTPHVYTITYTGLTNEEAAALRTAGNPDTYTIESPSFTLKNPEDRYDTDGDKTQHFEGWRESTVSTEITLPQVSSLSDKIYEAIWSDVATPEYNIIYEYNNGTATPANRTKFTKFDTFTLTEPTKEGYTFTGWTGTDLANETKPYTVPTGIRHDLEFTAHYRKNNYTIAFAKGADDATGVTASIAAEYDTEYDLPASGFARTGYTQNGWKKGEETIAADAKVKNLTAEDGATITLTANWEANHYTIKFEKNAENVEGTINPIDATYDTGVALSCNGFAKEHYKLMGWASSSTGSAVYECDASVKNLTAEPNGEVTLYAVWLERTAMLNTGSNVNTALKAINADAMTFTHYTGTPEIDAIENKRNIALATSNFPVYIWGDNSTIYWWSEAENVYMNADSGSMFKGTNFVSIDASGFDASTATNMQLMFIDTRNVENINISGWDTSNVTTMYAMFNRAGVNKEGPINVDLTELDVQNVLSFDQMFKETKFVTLDLSSWNVESVTNTRSMFSSMPNLTTLNISGFDLSGLGSNKIALFDSNNPSVVSNSLRTSPTTVIADNVVFNENMSDLFYSQVNLTEVSLAGVDTSRTTNMNRLLQLCTSLTSVDLRDADFENVTDMSGMFAKDSNLETVLFADNINTGNVTTMAGMFNEAEKLSYVDVSHFNTSNVTNMLGMFRFTPLLTTVDVSHFDTSKLEGSIESLFSKNGATELDLSTFDTSRVTVMRNLFLNNTAVTTIYATDKFVTTLVPDASVNTDGHNLFSNTPNLVGGAGTAYTSSAPRSKEYARIDDPDNGKPGYFTPKNARYIRYHDNDGDTTNDETNYALMPSHYMTADSNNPYNLATKLAKNSYARGGYRFIGWATSADGEAIYADEVGIANLEASKVPLELYAVWEPTGIAVTFNANSSDATGEMQPQIITDGNQTYLALNAFERTYYNFLGWSTSADSSDVVYADGADITGLSGNLELFAVWERMSEFDIAMFDAGKTRIEAADGKMYYQMQDMNSDICAAVPTAQDNNANEGRLVDNRDGKVYWVSKLKDEHCWMVQNLDHDIVTTPGYYTPDNTDITQDWTPTLATMNASNILSWDNTDVPHSLDPGDWYVTDTYVAIANDQEYDYIANGPNDYFKNTPFSGNGERGHVGNYYSWNAAMAMNSSNGSTMPAKTSICPKGWTVSHGNYAGLLNAYGVDTSNPAQSDQFLTGAPIYLTHAGAVTSTTTGSVDGRLWRSGVQGAYWAYLRDASGINYNVNPKGDILMTSPTGVTPSIWTARGSGWSVRCLAK